MLRTARFGERRKLENVRVRQLDRFALLVAAHAELQVGVGELTEDAVGRVGHLVLHRQQLFLALRRACAACSESAARAAAESVRSGLAATYSLSFVAGSDEDLRPDEAGRLGRVRGGVLVAAHHPLIVAVGHVLGRFQMGVRAEPLAVAIEIAVELQALGERRRAVAERAAKLFVLRNLLFPLRERLFPLIVALEEAGEIPGVGRL